MRRPEGMSYEQFRAKRLALQQWIKQHLRGKLVHQSMSYSWDDPTKPPGKGITYTQEQGYYVPPSEEGSTIVQSPLLPDGSSPTQGEQSPIDSV